MVSFQCDACTDVVKKPKLDYHYGQCRSSFTCIDCSSTFAGSVEWKVHTSCITEAEKYQKSMYKGPKKGQGSRPGNGQSHTQLRTSNSTGKYHRSNGSQSSWSRPQYIRNCASGANTTPLGTPRRMSPVDPSEVKPSPPVANATTKTDSGYVEKRDAEKHTPSGTEPKEKRRKKKHDAPRVHDAPPTRDETNHEASKMKGSSEGHKRKETSGDDTQSKTQFATEDVPETSGDKKVKKSKKGEKGEKARLEQGDVSKETNTPPEPVVPSVDDDTTNDEKKVRKRKHKKKKEEDTEINHGSLTGEVATKLEPLVAAQTDDSKGEKKKKGKEEKAVSKKRKHEGSVVNGVEKKKRKRQEQEQA